MDISKHDIDLMSQKVQLYAVLQGKMFKVFTEEDIRRAVVLSKTSDYSTEFLANLVLDNKIKEFVRR